ncbi:MAG: efflux RND transporter permease subunit [Thermoanaerobaculia bacterium]|nr:efflux RND transporter permease subunit [Thermoanaerobaculia bacterium]
MSPVDISLRHRATVLFLTFAVVVLGLAAYLGLPREKYPDIDIPVIFVTTVYPGAAPTEVEKQITNPIEREVSGVDGLKKLTSRSMESASMVSVEFASGTDVNAALQRVRDRVELAQADFPGEAEEPTVEEINFSQIPILQIHLSGDVGPVRLKTLAEDLQDELETLPGVLRADLVGGRKREVKVDVDPELLRHYGLALQDVVDAVREENVSIPGGDLDLGDTTWAVRVPGEVENPLDMADFVVASPEGRPVYVSDVAEVRFGFEDRTSYSRIDGRESVALQIQKRVGANVLEVIERSKEVVEERSATWPAGVEFVYLADESEEILRQIYDLENSIASGLFLVVLVLMFALGLRNAIFVGLSIPFSMLLTFVVIQLIGVHLNMVVLFSLVLAVGMLVDNAVVVIENIYRFMQEGAGRLEAAGAATREVGAAVAMSTLTTVGAFTPLMFWPGMMGDFMGYLPMTVSLALLSSLVVAFTINPTLCSMFMRVVTGHVERPDDVVGEDAVREGSDSDPLLRRLGAGIVERYRRILIWCLDHRLATVGTALGFALTVLTLYTVFGHGVEFIVEEQPNQIKVDLDLPPGTRLEKTDRLAQTLEERLQGLTDLRLLATSVGEGSQSDDFGDAGATPHAARLVLDLVPRSERTQNSFRTLEEARRLAGTIPGAEIRVDPLNDGLPTGPPVALEISGDDFEVLGGIAERLRQAVETIPGVVSVEDDFANARPELVVHVDRVGARRLGLDMTDVASTVRTAMNGTEASTYRRGDEEIDVRVRLAEGSRVAVEDLERLTVVAEDGDQIPVSAVASVERSSSLPAIVHKNRKRLVTISGQVTASHLAVPAREEALRRANDIPDLLPSGYQLTIGGQQEEEEESKLFLEKAFLYGIFLVMAILVAQFDSVLIPLIIISSVLMSMFGVLVGLMIMGMPFSIILTGVGVISLAGIVVNNAIVLLDYAEQLRKRGLPRREVMVRTGLRRLRPVLLTATTTILGLLPLTTGVEFDFHSFSISTDSESSDYWANMGVSVIFGLAFATFLTLVFVPVLYDTLWGVREWARRRFGASEEKEPNADLGSDVDGEPPLEPEPAAV